MAEVRNFSDACGRPGCNFVAGGNTVEAVQAAMAAHVNRDHPSSPATETTTPAPKKGR